MKNKKKYRVNNKKKATGRRRYKCYDCGQRFGKYDQLFNHVTKYHKDLIDCDDPHEYIFQRKSPGIRMCTICHKNPCPWNSKTRKYTRYCTNPECAKRARELFRKNMKRVYGTDNLLNDPEHQANMLANRKISGKFTFPDGTEVVYTGKYELDFLEHCVNVLNLNSTDIVPTPTSIYIKYYDTLMERDRFYIPDFYMPRYNLAIEIKDSSKFPVESKLKMKMKEDAVIKLKKYNYIKIVDKVYDDFDELIQSFEENMSSENSGNDELIFIIPETDIDSDYLNFKSSLNN